MWELPPNGQGVAALQALSLLDGLADPTAPVEERVHLQVEAMKLAFADAHAYVADPDLGPGPDLLDPAYLARRRSLIGPGAADARARRSGPRRHGLPLRGRRDGTMVSLIQSTTWASARSWCCPGTASACRTAGPGSRSPTVTRTPSGRGKRPFHTIIPGFLTRGGEPVGPFGVMGGHMQPQGHVQVVAATVDRHLDPQAALDAPRWYWDAGLRRAGRAGVRARAARRAAPARP